MDASRKRPPERPGTLELIWPDTLSGHFALELGLSGGADSMALLHRLLAERERRDLTLSAVHVHHGLSPHADAWAGHCRDWCARWDVPLRVEYVHVAPRGGESLEAVARRERYRVYAASRADVLALAHHQDDLAETVLLQLLRGAGPRGLAAMPLLRALTPRLSLWRPLLGVTRAAIEAYARAHGIIWVDDESNADTRWRRNLLRHRVLPLLEQELPHYRSHLQRSAQLAADAAQVLDEVAVEDLARCADGDGLSVPRLAMLSAPRQRLLLQHWCTASDYALPSPDALEVFRHQALGAEDAAHPQLRLDGGLLLRHRQRLLLRRLAPTPQPCTLDFVPDGELPLPGWAGRLRWQRRSPGLAESALRDLRLLPRAGGERLAQRVGRKPVKTLLQEADVPAALRGQWPLLAAGDTLLAVPGVAVSHEHLAEQGWWPQWLPD